LGKSFEINLTDLKQSKSKLLSKVFIHLYNCKLFCRTLNLSDSEFNLNIINKNGLSEESLNIEDSKSFLQPKNDSFQLKPLGDITIQIDDIVPCVYSTILHLLLYLKTVLNITLFLIYV